MMKMMTTTILAGTLLLGLASSAFAARTPASETRHAEMRVSRLAGDPAPRRVSHSECSIAGAYDGKSYCFGGDHSAAEGIY